MASPAPPDQRHWSLDKRVPLALIITLSLQTGGAVWWAANLSSRVTSLEDKIAATASYDARLVKLETNAENIKQALENISAKLDRLIERRQ